MICPLNGVMELNRVQIALLLYRREKSRRVKRALRDRVARFVPSRGIGWVARGLFPLQGDRVDCIMVRFLLLIAGFGEKNIAK